MEYILNFGYRTIHKISIQLHELKHVLKTGKSKLLKTAVNALQESRPLLETMDTAPYSLEQINLFKEIYCLLLDLLYLPDNVLDLIEECIELCEVFTDEVEPFFLETDKIPTTDRERVADHVNKLLGYSEKIISCLESGSYNCLDQLSNAEVILEDIIQLSTQEFSEVEKSGLTELIANWIVLATLPTLENALLLSDSLHNLERLFSS